ncbi:hypothetical protein EVAR_3535_1 [Eumeta japonica]|uniref:Uncharacterized protein n=1 Tax=Eumeta variegata TaxID=151549 RepID=A0A4C1SW47_EUMVA|nr:hypothetical protein EVAR_3535_1 [Eumeta japonica]
MSTAHGSELAAQLTADHFRVVIELHLKYFIDAFFAVAWWWQSFADPDFDFTAAGVEDSCSSICNVNIVAESVQWWCATQQRYLILAINEKYAVVTLRELKWNITILRKRSRFVQRQGVLNPEQEENFKLRF